jgi:hypothetical protein
MGLTLDQQLDSLARCLDAAFQSLPFSAKCVEKFGQLDDRDRQSDWISRRVPSQIQTL